MAKVTPKKKSNTGFLAVIGIILIAGGAGIWTTMQKKPVSIEAAPGAALPAAEGYLRGNPNAPISIIEFADFECPGCGQFATLQGPDIKTRIVDAGLANFRFFDFPLTAIHPNTIAAHMAAACANDQGKFWEMHDLIFAGQYDWNGQATSNPRKFMDGYAKQLGLDMTAFASCFDTQKHLPRIQANAKMGQERGVGSTPTIMINDRLYPGGLSADQIKKIVDSLTAAIAAAPAAPAAAK
ncbi:MAG: thioredoxin domain-containing protein [Gemmatimonadaceae bacterium]|nr:thioredoxin domain-containing protein [Gemmatimonadaceae bacterium]